MLGNPLLANPLLGKPLLGKPLLGKPLLGKLPEENQRSAFLPSLQLHAAPEQTLGIFFHRTKYLVRHRTFPSLHHLIVLASQWLLCEFKYQFLTISTLILNFVLDIQLHLQFHAPINGYLPNELRQCHHSLYSVNELRKGHRPSTKCSKYTTYVEPINLHHENKLLNEPSQLSPLCHPMAPNTSLSESSLSNART